MRRAGSVDSSSLDSLGYPAFTIHIPFPIAVWQALNAMITARQAVRPRSSRGIPVNEGRDPPCPSLTTRTGPTSGETACFIIGGQCKFTVKGSASLRGNLCEFGVKMIVWPRLPTVP